MLLESTFFWSNQDLLLPPSSHQVWRRTKTWLHIIFYRQHQQGVPSPRHVNVWRRSPNQRSSGCFLARLRVETSCWLSTKAAAHKSLQDLIRNVQSLHAVPWGEAGFNCEVKVDEATTVLKCLHLFSVFTGSISLLVSHSHWRIDATSIHQPSPKLIVECFNQHVLIMKMMQTLFVDNHQSKIGKSLEDYYYDWEDRTTSVS